MSRRYLPSSSSQHPFVSQYSSDNTYQVTTLPKTHTYCNPLNPKECYDLSETEISSYHNSYEYQHIKEPKTTDCMFSGSDGSSLKCYPRNEEFSNRFSNDHSSFRKSVRKVYPTYERAASNPTATVTVSLPHRLAVTHLTERPKSSLSAASTVIVDGCGGHCQTFENVCYYFLQVIFTMGILIGISLSIAGAVLRKSAARNLQVLVYIGVMLSVVSFVLLYIQCTARYSARKRKKVVRSKMREPIPLVPLPTTATQQQLLIESKMVNHRCDAYPNNPGPSTNQGEPWWRRKEPG